MKSRLTILMLMAAACAMADTQAFKTWFDTIGAVGGSISIEQEKDDYLRVRLADSCYYEMQDYKDSVLVVYTACVPACTSVARMYNNEWELLRNITPATQGILPYATIVDGQLVWQDNTVLLLDEEEKREIKK